MKTKKEIEREIEQLRKEQQDLEQKEFLEKAIPAAQKAVGDCFVYRNNSNGGGNRKFDTFYRVIAFTPRTKYNYGVVIVYERAQIDSEGRASVEIDSKAILPGSDRRDWNHVGLLASCVLCSREEYDATRNRILNAFEHPAEFITTAENR